MNRTQGKSLIEQKVGEKRGLAPMGGDVPVPAFRGWWR